MSKESKEQQLDQLLRGVYRMCVNRDDCNGCPFYITKCTFEEPKPSTWFDEETIEISAPVEAEKPVEQEVAETPAEPVAPALIQPVAQPAAADDNLVNDSQLVAVITAAINAYIDSTSGTRGPVMTDSKDKLVVRSIRRVR